MQIEKQLGYRGADGKLYASEDEAKWSYLIKEIGEEITSYVTHNRTTYGDAVHSLFNPFRGLDNNTPKGYTKLLVLFRKYGIR